MKHLRTTSRLVRRRGLRDALFSDALFSRGERGMVRFAAAAITLTVLISSFAFAQDATPKMQVFGGYSLLRADHGGLTGGLLDVDLQQTSNPFALRNYFLDGWNAEAQYNAGRWLGIAADFGGRY